MMKYITSLALLVASISHASTNLTTATVPYIGTDMETNTVAVADIVVNAGQLSGFNDDGSAITNANDLLRLIVQSAMVNGTVDANSIDIAEDLTVGGIMYGDASGLTNINVAVAIPDESITVNKLVSEILTEASLTNGSIISLSVGQGTGPRRNKVELYSLGAGQSNTATNYSVAFGKSNKASGLYSFASGFITVASGENAHAEGEWTTASGKASHAEGYSTVASGYPSHAEGMWTEASGSLSHAEGHSTIATGFISHAEGYLSKASELVTHASGWNAHAAHERTFVWSSSDSNSTEFASTTNHQFSVFADNGIRLITGSNATVEVGGAIILSSPAGDIPMFSSAP